MEVDIRTQLKDTKISIFSHSCEGTTGIDDELLLYLTKSFQNEVVTIKFPFTFSSKAAIKVIVSKDGQDSTQESLVKFYKPEYISYIKDFLYGIMYGLKFCRGTELFFGMNNLLVIVGLILKKLGIVKKVAYYMIDYTPVRYTNPFLNRLYYILDKIACYQADIVLPLNKEMIGARFKDQQLDSKRVNYYVTPFGNNSNQYTTEDYVNYSRFKIAYFGGVLKSKGAELFIPIVQALLEKGLKNVVFECIGGGDISYLKEQVKQYGLENHFNIYGRIENHHEVEKILLTCGVAIAPYYPEDTNNFSYYADPGKTKVYLGCGLPIVITKVPPIALIIEAHKAGLISEYSADDIANNILKIANNEETYKLYRHNAIILGKKYAWDSIFESMLKNFIKL